jgi:hypothetical protein
MLRAPSHSPPNLTQRLTGGPEGQHDPTRRSLHGRGDADSRDLVDGEVPGGMATTGGFLIAKRAQRARRWRRGSSRRGSSPTMVDDGACMAAVAPSLPQRSGKGARRLRGVKLSTERRKRGEETKQEGASHDEQCSTAMAAVEKGAADLALT